MDAGFAVGVELLCELERKKAVFDVVQEVIPKRTGVFPITEDQVISVNRAPRD